MVYILNGVLFDQKEEHECVICRKLDGTKIPIGQDKPDLEKQIFYERETIEKRKGVQYELKMETWDSNGWGGDMIKVHYIQA